MAGVRLKVKGGSNWTCPWDVKDFSRLRWGAVSRSPLIQRLSSLRELQVGRYGWKGICLEGVGRSTLAGICRRRKVWGGPLGYLG